MANPRPTRTGSHVNHPTLGQVVTQRLNELEILRLSVEEGLQGSEIARHLGVHKSTVTRTLQRMFARNEAPLVEQKRAAEHATLMAARAVLIRAMLTPHLHVSDGRVVRNADGEPILDDGPNIAAARALVANVEQVSKLWGLNAPTRVEARFTDATDAAIEQLAAELEVLAVSGQGTPAPAIEPGTSPPSH